jgi:hypothetical protein
MWELLPLSCPGASRLANRDESLHGLVRVKHFSSKTKSCLMFCWRCKTTAHSSEYSQSTLRVRKTAAHSSKYTSACSSMVRWGLLHDLVTSISYLYIFFQFPLTGGVLLEFIIIRAGTTQASCNKMDKIHTIDVCDTIVPLTCYRRVLRNCVSSQ